VDKASEMNALRRSTVRCNEILSSVEALEAYCALLVDLAQPRPPGLSIYTYMCMFEHGISSHYLFVLT
jgi:hypothetical protein